MTVHTCGHCAREYGTADLLELHQRASPSCHLIDGAPRLIPPASVLRNAETGRPNLVVDSAQSGPITPGALTLIGIDPGLTRFGVAVAELPNLGSGKPRFIKVEVWRTEPSAELKRKLRKMDDTAERVGILAEQLHDLVQQHRPVALCIEALALPYGKIQLQVAVVLGRVRGVVDALAKVHHLAVLEEMPQRLKKLATGKNGASKLEVQEALEREYPELRELWPPQKTLLEHAADAAGAIHACRGADVVLAARAAAARAA